MPGCTGERTFAPAELLALVALGLLVLALNITPITNNDIFIHLKTGAIILETRTVPRTDDYSVLARGQPYVAHEWLSAVIFRIVERLAGLDALILFKAGVALLVALALYAAARRFGASAAATLPLLAFVMILAAARFYERPHVFTYLFTAVFLLLLARRRARAHAPLWVFVFPQCLWANLHGGFFLGPALVALAAAAEGFDSWLEPWLRGSRALRSRLPEARRLAFLVPVLIVVSLLNPYGVDLLLYTLRHTTSGYMQEIYEWLPPFGSSFATNYMFRYYVAWVVLGTAVLSSAFVLAIERRELPPAGAFPLLVFLMFLAMSLRMNRNVTDFALATLPGISASATWLGAKRSAGAPSRFVLGAIAVILLGFAAWFCINGYAYSSSSRRRFGLGLGENLPVAAADYLEANGIRGNAFNTYNYGAYLIYRFYPELRVAMDSRNVHTDEQYAAYKRALGDANALRAMLANIGASVVFLDWVKEGSVAAPLIRRVGGWSLVYFDDRSAIFLPAEGEFSEVVERDHYDVLDPFAYRAGSLRSADGTQALEEAERAIRWSRGAYLPRVMKVEALLNLGRQEEAFAEEARIVAEAPSLHLAYSYLGQLRLDAGQKAEAAALFQRALELEPESPAAQNGLERARSSR